MMEPAAGPPHTAGGDPILDELVDEFAQALQAGSPESVEAFAQRHPDYAEELRRILPAMQVLAELGSAHDAPIADAAGSPSRERFAGTLGDFRIRREIGRGGMGVVYEAEQISLGRRVALKVLPFASTLDPKQLQRFKNEAQAAAGLHHTNIVPVFAIGCERGVHYYAMQFIEGHTLAQVIAEMREPATLEKCRHSGLAHGSAEIRKPDAASLRSPSGARGDERVADAVDLEAPTVQTDQERGSELAAKTVDTPPEGRLSTRSSARGRGFFQAVARLGIQAAEALHYAHELGVIHRDIKPANLLVDGRGTLWITDFGLAHCQSQAGLTMSGDLVGTLRYMSPEQALARRMLVDHCTDIYSLGASLYELLTGEPVFSGGDREELLRQIAFEEPRPLRRLNKAIPMELEAIVLKALEKNPGDRYATAQELAEDLKRHLQDEPIRARRPSVRIRLTKWARRHKPLVAGFASAAVILLIGLAVGAFWYAAQASALAAQRLHVSSQITDALAEARDLMSQTKAGGREQPVIWARAREAAGRARTLAESSLAAPALVKNVRELHQKLDEEEQDRRMIAWLEEARLGPSNLKLDDDDVKWVRNQYTSAFQKYGIDVQGLPVEEAGARIRQRAIQLALVTALDDWAVKTRDASQRGRLLAIARAADHDPKRDQIRAAYLQGDRRVLKTLSVSADISTMPVATLLLLEAALEDLKEMKAAADLLRRAQAVHIGDFSVNYRLGIRLLHQPPALPANALPFFMIAAAVRPDSAIVRSNLGGVFYKMGQKDAAMAQFREALRLNPDLAPAHSNLGNIYKHKGLLDDAIREYREAIRLNKDFADPHNNLGDAYTRLGKRDEAISEFREAIRLRDEYSEAHANLAAALAARGLLDEAIAECEKVIQINAILVVQAHQRLGVMMELKGQRQASLTHHAEAHSLQAVALHQKRDLTGAIAEYREALRLRPNDVRTLDRLGIVLAEHGDLEAAIAAFRQAIALKDDFGPAHSDLAVVLTSKGRLDEAITECRQALRFESDNPLTYFRLGTALSKKGDFRSALEAMRRCQDLDSRDPNWSEETAELVRRQERCVELDDKLPAILDGKSQPASAQEGIELAELCMTKQLYAAAARFYEVAFSAQPGLASGRRFRAASVAALGGCGQGKEVAKLDEPARAHLRGLALHWLRDELAPWMNSEGTPELEKGLRHWQGDPALAGVRDPQALTKLPAAEQRDWRSFWADITRILERGKGSP